MGDLQTLKTEVSSKASVTELHSVETNLKNQIDSKASEMDLQTLKTEVSNKASVTELHSVETNLQNQIDTKISKMVCSTDSPGYHLFGKKCIYFEKTSLTWENAKKGCKDKFSNGGKLFEPRSLQENNEVFAQILFGLEWMTQPRREVFRTAAVDQKYCLICLGMLMITPLGVEGVIAITAF